MSIAPGDSVDAHVRDLLLHALEGTRLPNPGDGDGDAATLTDLAQLQQRRAVMAEMFASGRLEMNEWLAGRTRVDAEIAALQPPRRLPRIEGLPAALTYQSLRATWDLWSLEQRRTLLARCIERIEVLPATSTRPGFKGERLGDPIWLI